VLKADSEVMLGRVAEAGVLLASASDACDSSQLETVAEVERVTAKALARQGRLTDAVPALDRAMRIADVVGNACLRAYIEADRPLITATGSVRERPGSTGARTARDATVLLQCGGRPELLGQEAMALLASLGYPGECRVERDDRNTDGGTLRIELGGSEGQVAWVLCVTPPGEFRAAEDLATVRKLITHALELERASRQARQRASFWEKAPLPRSAVAGVFVAKSTLDILDSAMKVAPTDIPILLTGETGTGKELLARAIHDGSPRAERTFLPFDCNSVPRDLLDSHLFGHRRGAFSGALENFPGVIRAAEGGTLFLDEIGELSLDLQPKLLRFLETRQVHPLGESNPVTVDVRIVAATNANLDRLVAEGGFREDLFYRLNVIRFPLPPLRERREEIPPLAHHFLRHHAEDQGQAVPRLSDETLEYLLLYRWPGNVRELGNEMRRLVAFADPGAVIEPDALSPHILASRRTVPAAPRPSDRTVQVTLGQPLQRATDQLERAMIVDALAKTGGRVEAAARLLGLSRKGLYLKRQRLSVAS